MGTPRATERFATEIPVSGDKAMDSTNVTVRIIGTGTIRAVDDGAELVLTDVIISVGSNIVSDGLVVTQTLELTGTATLAATDVIRFGEGATLILKEDSLQLPSCGLGNVSLIASIPKIEVNGQGLGTALQQRGDLDGFQHVLLTGTGWPIKDCRANWLPKVQITGPDRDMFQTACRAKTDSGRMFMGRVALAEGETVIVIEKKAPEEEDGASGGAVAGGIIGALFALAAIGCAVYVIRKKRQLQTAFESSVTTSPSDGMNSVTEDSGPGEEI